MATEHVRPAIPFGRSLLKRCLLPPAERSTAGETKRSGRDHRDGWRKGQESGRASYSALCSGVGSPDHVKCSVRNPSFYIGSRALFDRPTVTNTIQHRRVAKVCVSFS